MRKSKAIVIWLVFLSLPVFGGQRGFVSIGAGVALSGDQRFQDVYGTLHLSPELRAGYGITESIYLWLGYSFFSAAYTIPLLLDEAEVSQRFLAFGAGWEMRRGRLQSDFFVGLAWAGFRESALGESLTASAPGFQLGTGLRYRLGRRFFIGGVFSYTEARVTLAPTATTLPGRRFLGGLRLAASLGWRF